MALERRPAGRGFAPIDASNPRRVPVLSKAWGVGTTTFKSALKKCEARAVKHFLYSQYPPTTSIA